MILYQDALIKIEIPSTAYTRAEFLITFNKEVSSFEELAVPQREHAYYAASFAATTLFENTGAIGTNIIVRESPLRFLVVAQFEDESHSFLWEPVHVKEDKMKEIAARIKDKCDYIGVKQPSKEPLDMDKAEVIEEKKEEPEKEEEKKEEDSQEKDEEPKEPVDEKVRVIEKNYLLDQLRRGA